jgi:uncharacterized RDD family membrane protein YckC
MMTFPDDGAPEESQFPEQFEGPVPSPPAETSPVQPPAPSVTKLERTPVVQDLAPRGRRLAARLIDGATIGVPWFLATVLGDGILSTAMGILVIAVTVYQVLLLTRDGQTIGKSLLGIRIVRMDTGKPAGFLHNVLLREVVNLILGFIPFYSLIDACFIFRDHQRCIHDFIAGTRVVNV